jgi:hypothetical protein
MTQSTCDYLQQIMDEATSEKIQNAINRNRH